MDTLLGITFALWKKALRENQYKIDPPYLSRALKLTAISLFNTRMKRKEDALFAEKIARTTLPQDPIFIIGHWRSGTTLLHSLFALDPQFAYPNLYEVSNPFTFLIMEDRIAQRRQRDTSQKRPMDNVQVRFDSPAEDEFAINNMSLLSPIGGWSFPRNEAYYDRFLTLEQVSDKEIKEWKRVFLLFLKKLTFRYRKPLVLKSPTHTCRIGLLLEMFPKARFIHIHRNPYTVFRSTQKLYRTAVPRSYLQNPDPAKIDEGILKRYCTMYYKFLAERDKIPNRQFFQLSFEALEQRPIEMMEKIYQHLGLVGFDRLLPRLKKEVESWKGYRKNVHPPLSPELVEKINDYWGDFFKAFGYPMVSKPVPEIISS